MLFGRSLGSGPVCRLALRLQELGEKVGGVILHSPFVSVREVGLSLLGPVAHVMSDRWDNEKPLAALRCRLLIIHGASDEVVPFTHAEQMRDIRVANKLHVAFFPTQGTHNYFSYYRDYLHPVENFLEGHKARALPPLPDPLPRADSPAQVKEIMELRAKRKSETSDGTDAHADVSAHERENRRPSTRSSELARSAGAVSRFRVWSFGARRASATGRPTARARGRRRRRFGWADVLGRRRRQEDRRSRCTRCGEPHVTDVAVVAGREPRRTRASTPADRGARSGAKGRAALLSGIIIGRRPRGPRTGGTASNGAGGTWTTTSWRSASRGSVAVRGEEDRGGAGRARRSAVPEASV